ncbi:unnamed protein product [Symbiodinium necroappetens]|uniref:Uncharacterized protein n=1 Tax=Symbiodinium necroappetens TaxID=1628268 RepID=A0A812S5H5_9DINO|nr:unnamed protein product [Symbiodinium necroappetens]
MCCTFGVGAISCRTRSRWLRQCVCAVWGLGWRGRCLQTRSLLGTGLASVLADLLPVFLRCIVGPGCHRHETVTGEA